MPSILAATVNSVNMSNDIRHRLGNGGTFLSAFVSTMADRDQEISCEDILLSSETNCHVTRVTMGHQWQCRQLHSTQAGYGDIPGLSDWHLDSTQMSDDKRSEDDSGSGQYISGIEESNIWCEQYYQSDQRTVNFFMLVLVTRCDWHHFGHVVIMYWHWHVCEDTCHVLIATSMRQPLSKFRGESRSSSAPGMCTFVDLFSGQTISIVLSFNSTFRISFL